MDLKHWFTLAVIPQILKFPAFEDVWLGNAFYPHSLQSSVLSGEQLNALQSHGVAFPVSLPSSWDDKQS